MLRAAARLLSNWARAMPCVLPVLLSKGGGRWLGASTRMCLGVILMCLGVIGTSAASLHSPLVMESCYDTIQYELLLSYWDENNWLDSCHIYREHILQRTHAMAPPRAPLRAGARGGEWRHVYTGCGACGEPKGKGTARLPFATVAVANTSASTTQILMPASGSLPLSTVNRARRSRRRVSTGPH